jgi:hypothetical protein
MDKLPHWAKARREATRMTEAIEHAINEKIVIDSGSVTTLVKGDRWPDLAKTMKATYLPIQQRQEPKIQAGFVVSLCTVYYAYGQQRVIHTGQGDILMGKDNLEKLIDVLEEFMEQNGQWTYIKQQKWYTSREYVIGIDVNYYPDRSGFTTFIAFHKDTDGNNIFVNLIFDNDGPIEATEWFADVGEPSKQRKKLQEQLLPDAYLKQLDRTRAALRSEMASKDIDEIRVAGGVSPYAYTYVSWLDDLIWHSTPNGNKRAEYSAADAVRAYDELDRTVDRTVDPVFGFGDEKLNAVVLGWEILGTMAESKDTELYRWLKERGLEKQDLGFAMSQLAWKALYRESGAKTGGRKRLFQDATTRALFPWRITQRYSEANTADERTPGSTTIRETPALLSRIRRSNSFKDVQAELEKVRKANVGKARAFARTWVRILRSDNPELTEHRIVFVPKT